MSSKNGNPQLQEEMKEKISTVERANTTSVLMAQLCKELGLEPMNTTHQQFVDAFTALQKKSLEYQKELQEMYISSTNVKPNKKRKAKKSQLEEVLDSMTPGDQEEMDNRMQEILNAEEEVGF